jgi:hypothetical protein
MATNKIIFAFCLCLATSLPGANQWTYSIESKINANDNRLTAGYGEILKMGDPLAQNL